MDTPFVFLTYYNRNKWCATSRSKAFGYLVKGCVQQVVPMLAIYNKARLKALNPANRSRTAR